MAFPAFGASPETAQRIRFVLTGALNTAVGFALYAGLVVAGLAMAWALFVATALGMLFNFFSFGHLTFRQPGMHRLPRFLLAYSVIYLANLALLWAVRQALGLDAIVAQLACLPFVAAGAYFLLRSKVFGEAR